MPELMEATVQLLRDICLFCEDGSKIKLRAYQEAVARAVVDSVIHRRGLSLVVMFPRQSGKNELQAQIETYLLTLFSHIDAEMVKVSPTWKPQTYNAMKRLERVLKRNLFTELLWQKERDYIYRVGRASIKFLSGSPEASLVGATASLLLEVDEAQDVQIGKFDRDIAPMAASTNATRVFWGTAWTSQTLLHRELEAARAAEKRDGLRRAFVLTVDQVAAEVPEYGEFVRSQAARLGRENPMVKSQYYSEEIDADGGMFPPPRLALMQGSHAPQAAPSLEASPGSIYAMLLDIAGEDEGLKQAGALSNPGRDATALTVVEVDLSSLADPIIKAPTYRAVSRSLWVGVKHAALYGEIKALADLWRVRCLVMDATGVGAGLASFLEKALPGRVIPFIFTSASKSRLGWDFLGIVDSGRWKEYRCQERGAGHPVPGDRMKPLGPAGMQIPAADSLQETFYQELAFCQYEILPGPEKRMRWGVPDGTRDPASGELVHDDLALSAALAAILDGQAWSLAAPGVILATSDPLAEMDRGNY